VACDCSNPGDALVRRALDELGLRVEVTWMVGDSWIDVAASRRAGCRTLLVGPEWRLAGTLPPDRQPDIAAWDLGVGIEAILAGTADERTVT
jgi:histidinol phosphatase-like enzyme